jgi:hypothetical protein
MAYNRKNQFIRIKKIQDIVQQHYIEDVTSYKGIWREYVVPVYPCSYATFLKYINTAVPRNLTKDKDETSA